MFTVRSSQISGWMSRKLLRRDGAVASIVLDLGHDLCAWI